MVTKRKKKTKGSFKGKVSRNAAKQSRGTALGHLNLPADMPVYYANAGTRVLFDILPYEVTSPNHLDRDEEYEVAVEGQLWYKLPYLFHRNIGSSNEAIVCPTSAKRKCPICEHRAKMLRDGADWADDAVKALKPSKRNLYRIIPKGHKDYKEAPHIFDIAQANFQTTLNEEVQENEKYETFPDLEEGWTLKVRFSEGQIGSNKFAEASRIDFVERKKPYDESILDGLASLDDILIIPTYKDASKLFFEGMDQDEIYDDDDADYEEEYDEDEDEEPEEEYDEDEDEEPEDDEDEEPEPEPPKPKRGKKPAKSKKAAKNPKCPHGHTFGEDCEEYDECDECDEWEACMEASEQ